jgi:hypothetical protein
MESNHPTSLIRRDMRQIGIEDKKTGKHQVLELNDDFDNMQPEDLVVHLGLDTYTLTTTKTKEELDLERRVEFFQEKEFPGLMDLFPEFGEVQSDPEKHMELIKSVQDKLEERVMESETLKEHYSSLKNKEAFIKDMMMSFAQQVAVVKGIEAHARDAEIRRTHKCFPLDYSNRIMDVMRKILNDKYKDLDTLNKEFSSVFQDATVDTRPKVGMLRMLVGLEEFTKFLADVMRAGREVRMWEISEPLKEKAELTYTLINKFKNSCIKESKANTSLNEDKFADYLTQFYNLSVKCVEDLTDLDKRQETMDMDQLELRHHVDTIVETLFTECDGVILRYTMDERPDIAESHNSYIIAFYDSLYSVCDNTEKSNNRYVELYRHLINLTMQQKTLFEKTGFPDKLDEFKQYVEREYTNILRKNKSK